MRNSDIRRENARLLARQSNPKHPIKGFAEKLGKSSSLISQYIGKNPSKNIGDDVAAEIEQAYGKPVGWLDTLQKIDTPDGGTVEIRIAPDVPGTHDAPLDSLGLQLQRVPVVGTAQGGDEGFHEELSYPVGHGDGFLLYPCNDLTAYALQIKGESMFPRYRHGEYIVVTPRAAVNPGDEVVVRTEDGRVMLKILAYIRGGHAYLDSLKEGFAQVVVPIQDIKIMHLIAGRATHALWRAD